MLLIVASYAARLQKLFGSYFQSSSIIAEYLNFKAFKNIPLNNLQIDGLVICTSEFADDHKASTYNLLDSLLSVWGNPTFTLKGTYQYHQGIFDH
jgi:Fe-S-cluster formation regulator IscX/YfhJ